MLEFLLSLIQRDFGEHIFPFRNFHLLFDGFSYLPAHHCLLVLARSLDKYLRSISGTSVPFYANEGNIHIKMLLDMINNAYEEANMQLT